MGLMLKAILLLAAVYLAIVVVAWAGQRRLMYFPDPARVDPAAVGLTGVEEVVLTAPDGARLVAWRGKAAPGQPTLLYFHGNAGALANRAERIRKYMDEGRGVLMLAYRGYGGSSGTPTERDNVADATLAYDYLRAAGLRPDEIVVYGESLGSGVATQLAAAREVAGLVLDAPYTSAADVGAAAYPYLPVRLLMSDRYDTLAVIGRVAAPLLVVHGEKDQVIPVAMGRAVLAAHRGRKAIATFAAAGHADHHLFGSYEAINAWIDRLRAP